MQARGIGGNGGLLCDGFDQCGVDNAIVFMIG
jgi:hypothetical protein